MFPRWSKSGHQVYFWSTVKVVLFEISSQAGKSNNCEPQQTLPPRQGGDLQDVCGVPPQGPSEEALQGGRWYRCWQPGHSSEQQGGVLATSSTEHRDSKGIWENYNDVYYWIFKNKQDLNMT